MAAKVIKLTDNSGVTLMPLTDAKYVQITYAGVTKSVHDAILENEEITAAALTELDIDVNNKADIEHNHLTSEIIDINNVLADYATMTAVESAVSNSASNINLTYTSGTGIGLSGGGSTKIKLNGSTYINVTNSSTTLTIQHKTSGITAGAKGPSANATLYESNTFVVPQVTVDNCGHVTASTNRTFTMGPAGKVKYTSQSGNSYYPLLLSATASSSTPTNNSYYSVYYDSTPSTSVRYNPNTNSLVSEKIFGTSGTITTLGATTANITNLNLTNVPSNLQAKLTFDSIPTENSNNPVTSGGIYSTIVQNEQVTAAGLSVLNSRLTTVEDSLSSLNTDVYVSKAGTNVVDTSQEMKWASHNCALHINNTSLGWTGGTVNTGGLIMTYGAATFGKSGISIYSEQSNSGNYFVTSFPTGWTYVNIGHSTNGVSIKAGNNVGYIYATSDITAAKFYEQSDERLKSNINNICNIDDISLYEFDMNGSHMYGFVAQDLAQAYPELVKTTHDENKEIVDTLSVDYNSALTLTITKLYKKIKELEQRIIELENK